MKNGREIPLVFEIFSDRMELTSYGGLIPGQSERDFSAAAACRGTENLSVSAYGFSQCSGKEKVCAFDTF